MVTRIAAGGYLRGKMQGSSVMSADSASQNASSGDPPSPGTKSPGGPPSSSPNDRALGSLHSYPVLIREGHLDTFGHVNNATYLQLFEEARWDLIDQGGYGMDVIRETGQGPVILEVQVKFRRELKNRERATIETQLLAYQKKVASLRQLIVQENGSVACEAVFTMALWDTRARKLIPPTDRWLRAIGVQREQLEVK